MTTDPGDFLGSLFTTAQWIAHRPETAYPFLEWMANEIKQKTAKALIEGTADEHFDADLFGGFLFQFLPMEEEEKQNFKPLENDKWLLADHWESAEDFLKSLEWLVIFLKYHKP